MRFKGPWAASMSVAQTALVKSRGADQTESPRDVRRSLCGKSNFKGRLKPSFFLPTSLVGWCSRGAKGKLVRADQPASRRHPLHWKLL